MLIEPTRRRRKQLPVACAVIALVCLGLTIWESTLGHAARRALINHWGTIPSVLFGDSQATVLQSILTLYTSLFIHANWPHLLGNLAFLLLFGVATERALGSVRFTFLYLICGALASLVAAWQLGHASHTPVIGASGAVSAVIGAYLTLFPRASMVILLPLGLYIQFVRVSVLLVIGSWFTLQILYTWVGPAFGVVAWWAHITGFLSGILLALPAGPGSGEARLRRG